MHVPANCFLRSVLYRSSSNAVVVGARSATADVVQRVPSAMKQQAQLLLTARMTRSLALYLFANALHAAAAEEHTFKVLFCDAELLVDVGALQRDLREALKTDKQAALYRFMEMTDCARWCLGLSGLAHRGARDDMAQLCEYTAGDKQESFLDTLGNQPDGVAQLRLHEVRPGTYVLTLELHETGVSVLTCTNEATREVLPTSISENYAGLGGRVAKHLAEVLQNTIDAVVADYGGMEIGGFGEGGKVTFVMLLKQFNADIRIEVRTSKDRHSSGHVRFREGDGMVEAVFSNISTGAFTPRSMLMGVSTKSGFARQRVCMMNEQRRLVGLVRTDDGGGGGRGRGRGRGGGGGGGGSAALRAPDARERFLTEVRLQFDPAFVTIEQVRRCFVTSAVQGLRAIELCDNGRISATLHVREREEGSFAVFQNGIYIGEEDMEGFDVVLELYATTRVYGPDRDRTLDFFGFMNAGGLADLRIATPAAATELAKFLGDERVIHTLSATHKHLARLMQCIFEYATPHAENAAAIASVWMERSIFPTVWIPYTPPKPELEPPDGFAYRECPSYYKHFFDASAIVRLEALLAKTRVLPEITADVGKLVDRLNARELCRQALPTYRVACFDGYDKKELRDLSALGVLRQFECKIDAGDDYWNPDIAFVYKDDTIYAAESVTYERVVNLLVRLRLVTVQGIIAVTRDIESSERERVRSAEARAQAQAQAARQPKAEAKPPEQAKKRKQGDDRDGGEGGAKVGGAGRRGGGGVADGGAACPLIPLEEQQPGGLGETSGRFVAQHVISAADGRLSISPDTSHPAFPSAGSARGSDMADFRLVAGSAAKEPAWSRKLFGETLVRIGQGDGAWDALRREVEGRGYGASSMRTWDGAGQPMNCVGLALLTVATLQRVGLEAFLMVSQTHAIVGVRNEPRGAALLPVAAVAGAARAAYVYVDPTRSAAAVQGLAQGEREELEMYRRAHSAPPPPPALLRTLAQVASPVRAAQLQAFPDGAKLRIPTVEIFFRLRDGDLHVERVHLRLDKDGKKVVQYTPGSGGGQNRLNMSIIELAQPFRYDHSVLVDVQTKKLYHNVIG